MAQNISNLPVGAKVKFGKYAVGSETPEDIVWLIVAKSHSSVPAYPTNSITLLTEKIIDLRAFDAREPQNSGNARIYGNNRYSLSNVDQWLNADEAAGQWYSPAHDYDWSPQKDYLSTEATAGYDTRPGFLNAFTDKEKNAILNTPIRVAITTTGGGQEDISRKVFLPSASEVGLSGTNVVAEGSLWSYFSGNSKVAYLTSRAFAQATSTNKPANESAPWHYWLRTPHSTDIARVRGVLSSSELSSYQAYCSYFGVRPAVNVASTLYVSDTTDSTGCYSVVWNEIPTVPPTLNVPTTILAGRANTISWGKSTDLNGDTVTYVLECSYDGISWGIVYSGINTSYSHTIPYGEATNVLYRVKAGDGIAESAYITSAARTVINNTAPVISGSNSNLGVKSEGFTVGYTITDKESDSVTVIEAIDNVLLRTYVATPGSTNTLSVTDTTWLKLSNGSHTLRITAGDSYESSVREYTFTKNVDSFTIQNRNPMGSESMPTRIVLSVGRNIPSGAMFKVEVCNNGFDSAPTWEDATDTLTNGLVHLFENTKKTASSWGVAIRVSVARNGAEGACYVSAIGGNFE